MPITDFGETSGATGRPVFSGKNEHIRLRVVLPKPAAAACTDPFEECK